MSEFLIIPRAAYEVLREIEIKAGNLPLWFERMGERVARELLAHSDRKARQLTKKHG